MTFQQIHLVIEAAEAGSISAAAEKMQISQPNASQSLKKLEEELGYSLFRREGGGISPTEQGYLFLEHAQALLDEDRAIRAIGGGQRIPRLRVGVSNYTAAVEAFLRLCRERGGGPDAEFSCVNMSPDAGERLLKERKLDVVVSVQQKEALPAVEKMCRENRFTMKRHARIPVCVRMRKGHPLLEKGLIDGSLRSFQQLAAYPYADYRHLEHYLDEYNRGASVPFGYSYRIYVDERDTRLRVLSGTDAYNVGVALPAEDLERYGLASFPVGIEATLVTYVRKGDEKLPDIARYLELLDEETRRRYAGR